MTNYTILKGTREIIVIANIKCRILFYYSELCKARFSIIITTFYKITQWFVDHPAEGMLEPKILFMAEIKNRKATS